MHVKSPLLQTSSVRGGASVLKGEISTLPVVEAAPGVVGAELRVGEPCCGGIHP
jgi:hypothetical protein